MEMGLTAPSTALQSPDRQAETRLRSLENRVNSHIYDLQPMEPPA